MKMMFQEQYEKQGETSKLKTTNSTITKCPYGICDGSGMTSYTRDDVLFAKPCRCYEDRKLENRIEFAKIPEEFKDLTINSFDTNLYTIPSEKEKAIKAKKIVGSYIKDFDELSLDGKGLFLYSSTKGSGKTRLAISCGNALMNVRKQRVRFIRTLDLLGKIKESFNDDSEFTEQQLVNEFSEIPILILDDIGTEQPKPWVKEIFYRILDARMTCKRITIITSNLAIHELEHDERITSRLGKMVMRIQMPEEDIRRQIGEKENDMLIKKLLGV
ncbi:MAG: ATP-binding protein [Cellulosilyticaceae bacterium]